MPEDINPELPETEDEAGTEEVDVVAHGEGEEEVASGCIVNNSAAL